MGLIVFCLASCRESELKFFEKPEPVRSAGGCLLLLLVPAPEVRRESIQQWQKDRLL